MSLEERDPTDEMDAIAEEADHRPLIEHDVDADAEREVDPHSPDSDLPSSLDAPFESPIEDRLDQNRAAELDEDRE